MKRISISPPVAALILGQYIRRIASAESAKRGG